MKAALMAQKFDVAGRLVTVGSTGAGNVNDTYLAIFRTTFSEERFILQRVNKNVFPHPEYIMENMMVLTEHVHKRLEAEAHMSDRIWQLPRLIPAKDGQPFAIDGDGEYWRAISLIASAHSYEKVQSIEHAHEAGFVLGQFQRVISDIDVDRLHDTLVGFHITPEYLRTFDQAAATPEGQERLRSSVEAEHCQRFVEEHREWCTILEDAKDRGELSLRPIHGDPKIANIMIDDATGKGTCIVDLDTVKPGLIHYDVGDCLRSCCNPAGEEALDLSQVFFDTDLCDSIVSGYMAHARSFLTDADRHHLYDAARLIAFELGLRFFADFVAGDVYFKVRYDGQNLNRARVQFRLTESIEQRERIIRKTLDKA
ncbi:MAG: aminoglycoside phosphotransferase family protein [Lentisphaerae bacterium]|jgi:Ser/Thr protein kinase RdoA (MazF antagonist)|nr:aminoglycoside phosphotransferase family protein [Lentisphaerota bacterium]MBT4814180.1 aminoglycoside phosphotransferase family protein [Lentisphaerota bacterium]MBT7060540.1 aminoglycoside phosphotransferase family protein [Lentisphaerota bacterium]MBT7847993.1 aminoglycoside phosphotransferase family protein [Lentisphaerota bacterium]